MKQRTCITIDADVYRESKRRPEFNLSGFVNEAARAYLFGDAPTVTDAVLEQRRSFIDDRLAEVESTRSALEAELDRLDRTVEQRAAAAADHSSTWDAALEVFDPDDGRSGPTLEVGNPAVENWAGRLGVTQTELIAAVENGRPPGTAVTAPEPAD